MKLFPVEHTQILLKARSWPEATNPPLILIRSVSKTVSDVNENSPPFPELISANDLFIFVM